MSSFQSDHLIFLQRMHLSESNKCGYFFRPNSGVNPGFCFYENISTGIQDVKIKINLVGRLSYGTEPIFSLFLIYIPQGINTSEWFLDRNFNNDTPQSELEAAAIERQSSCVPISFKKYIIEIIEPTSNDAWVLNYNFISKKSIKMYPGDRLYYMFGNVNMIGSIQRVDNRYSTAPGTLNINTGGNIELFVKNK